jgi:hypothetical protein
MRAKGLRAAPTSARIIAAVAVVSLATFFTTHITHQQEDSLLRSDTAQAAALTSSMFSNTVTLLESLTTTVTTSGGSTTAFLAQAKPLVRTPMSVVLAKAYLAHYVIFASVGDGFRTGQLLNDEVAARIHRANNPTRPVPLFALGGHGVADFAVIPPFVPSGNLIYLQSDVSHLMASSLTTTPGFSNLRLALFGSVRPAAGNLIASTNHDLPLLGTTASAPVVVGNTTWTLEAQAQRPLIGGLASDAPWIVLLLGLSLVFVFEMIVDHLGKGRKKEIAESDSGEPVAITQFVTTANLEKLAIPEWSENVTTAEHPENWATLTAKAPVAEDAVRETSDGPVFIPNMSASAQPSESRSSVYADWRPDPFGRFELRRFFLERPTSVVRIGDTESYDPVTNEEAPADTTPDYDQGNAAEELATHYRTDLAAVADAIDEACGVASSAADTTADIMGVPGGSQPASAVRHIPPSPQGDDLHPARRHKPAKVLAVAGGIFGAVSLLRRHLRKPPRAR